MIKCLAFLALYEDRCPSQGSVAMSGMLPDGLQMMKSELSLEKETPLMQTTDQQCMRVKADGGELSSIHMSGQGPECSCTKTSGGRQAHGQSDNITPQEVEVLFLGERPRGQDKTSPM